MNPRDRLQYALYLQRLHELFVIKENIAFQYPNAHYNKAAEQIDKVVDKCLDNNIKAVVDGTHNLETPNLDHVISGALSSQQKMLVKTKDKYIQNAVEQNTKQFTTFIQNRIEKENYSLQAKIQKEYEKKKYKGMPEEQAKKLISEKFKDSARKRSKNIVKDALHTNQSQISWTYNVNNGMKYKVWMNGQSKSGVRSWHIKSKIQPVEIDDFFDIYGPKGHARMMYPGDLNGGAENVANCKCWLHYTNIAPSNLKKKGTIQINPHVNLENENATTFSANTEKQGAFTKIKTRLTNSWKTLKRKLSPKGNNFVDFERLTPKNEMDKSRLLNNKESLNKAKTQSESISLEELLEEYPDLPQIISLAAYHSKHADNENEYFSALSKDGRLLSVLHKGKKGQTRFPKTFKEEPGENILFTLHNHSHGAIIPSGTDIYNITNTNAPLTGIVSEDNFGLIINKNETLSEEDKGRIEYDFVLFDWWITDRFDEECKRNIKDLKKSYSGDEFKKKEQEMFEKYLSKNNERFGDEFNHRMEKYNIKLIQIKL